MSSTLVKYEEQFKSSKARADAPPPSAPVPDAKRSHDKAQECSSPEMDVWSVHRYLAVGFCSPG